MRQLLGGALLAVAVTAVACGGEATTMISESPALESTQPTATVSATPLPTSITQPTDEPDAAPVLSGRHPVLTERPIYPGDDVEVAVNEVLGDQVRFEVAWWDGDRFVRLYDWSPLTSEMTATGPGTPVVEDPSGDDGVMYDFGTVGVAILQPVRPGTVRICLGDLSCSTIQVEPVDSPAAQPLPLPDPADDASQGLESGVLVQCARTENVIGAQTLGPNEGGFASPELVADSFRYFPGVDSERALLAGLEEIEVETVGDAPASGVQVFGLPMESNGASQSFGIAISIVELRDGTYRASSWTACRDFLFG